MIKRSTIFIIILLIIPLTRIFGQQKLSKEMKTYYDLSNKLQWAKYKGNSSLAVNYFKQLEQIKKPNEWDIQNYIRVCVKMGNKAEANKWMEYSIKSFNYPCASYYATYLFKEYNYGLTKEEVLKMPCSLNEQKLLNEFITADKMQTIGTINHLHKNVRLFKNSFEELSFDNCIKDKHAFTLSMAKQYDSTFVLPDILKIIQKYNFPDEYDIGSSGTLVFNALLHQALSSKAHKLILDSALYNGKLHPKEYALLVEDLFNYDSKTKSTKNNYGIKLEKRQDGKIMQLSHIDNVVEVDKRRAEIGLIPLWQDAKIQNYALSKQYIDYLKSNNIPFEE